MKREDYRDEFIRKRIERQKRIRKRRLIVLFLSLIIITTCLGVVLCFTLFFPIEKIVASGSAVYTDAQIIEASDISLGDNLFSVSRPSVLKKLREKLPFVENLKIKRELPGTLMLTVTDANEYAVYEFEGLYYTVDKSGWVLEASEQIPEKLLTVSGCDIKCRVGSEIIFFSSEEKTLIENITGFSEESDVDLNRIDVSDKVNIKLFVDSRFEVQLGSENYLEEKIKHLSAMIDSISPEKTGKINLNMWINDKPQGTFVEKNE
ncbi:MAG: FtsQ-type POTRA domain-containing protein [Ruminococcaceae bacterium]|nr:FtsQ-type POTRA domain-containing protein [Oscillospiraceae bacterium]